MLRALLGRMRGDDGREPEVVTLDGVPPPGSIRADEQLIATRAVAPRAFYDDPRLSRFGRRARLREANTHALMASIVCPPYYALRADEARDLLFLCRGRAAERDVLLRIEVEFQGEGGVVRDLGFRTEDPGAPPLTVPLSPERALELEQVLRQGRFWQLSPLDDEGASGEPWWVSRLQRGRHHLIHRAQRSDEPSKLPELLAAVLDDELAVFAAERERREAAAMADRARTCAWHACPAPALPGDPSRLCPEHRARVDVQGERLQRKRG